LSDEVGVGCRWFCASSQCAWMQRDSEFHNAIEESSRAGSGSKKKRSSYAACKLYP
jgi:hypothetical protein